MEWAKEAKREFEEKNFPLNESLTLVTLRGNSDERKRGAPERQKAPMGSERSE